MDATVTPSESGGFLTIGDVAARCGRSPFAVRRWLSSGITTRAGRLRLKAVRHGGRWAVRPADLAAFVDELTRQALPADAPTAAGADGTPDAIRRRAKVAREELRRLGV